MSNSFDREVEALEREMERGDLSREEYRKALRELQRDYRDAAEESARDAYDREIDRW